MNKSIIDYVFMHDDYIIKDIKMNDKYKTAYERAFDLYKILEDKLDKKDFELFDEFANCEMAKECEATDSYFKTGLKLGLRLAAECFIDR